MPTICVDVMGSDQGPSVVLDGVERALAKDAELVVLPLVLVASRVSNALHLRLSSPVLTDIELFFSTRVPMQT